jgi:hypothetical protein
MRWQALKSQHIVGLFCPCGRSLLTCVWSAQAQGADADEERKRILDLQAQDTYNRYVEELEREFEACLDALASSPKSAYSRSLLPLY